MGKPKQVTNNELYAKLIEIQKAVFFLANEKTLEIQGRIEANKLAQQQREAIKKEQDGTTSE